MELIYDATNKRYWAKSSYDERSIPKTAGFRWNPDDKIWWTDRKITAAKLANFASDPTVKAELTSLGEAQVTARREAIAASRATDAAIQIPAPEGCEYLPYQKAGIAFAKNRFEYLSGRDLRGGVLFGDEMGLGKTIQAIGTINAIPEIKTVCVICPATVKANWVRELQKWLIRPFSTSLGTSTNVYDTDIVVVNYEAIFEDDPANIEYNKTVPKTQRRSTVKLRHDAMKRKFDFLIVDESHRLKTLNAKRTQAVDLIQADRVAYLTGTPIPNRHEELFGTLLRLDPEHWTYRTKGGETRPASWTFKRDFCGGGGASTRGEELQERMRTTFMVRRLKADVLTELPAKRRQIVELDANGSEQKIQDTAATIERSIELIEELEVKAELAKASDDEETYLATAKALKAARGIHFTEMSKVRHDEAVAMIPKAIDFIGDALEDRNHKVIVFAWHHDVMDAIAEAFQDRAVMLTGETKMEDRDKIVQQFQNNPEVQLFIGSITAAGVGITLTAASHVIFVEEDWVPSNITQAEDRVHRIGQKESVLIQHLAVNGSVSVKMIKTCIAKQEIADKALDSFIEPESDMVEGTASNYEATTKDVKRERITEEAATICAVDVKSIHDCIKILAGRCDWANTIDGVGYNKIDSRIGHELADYARLSAKQAVLAKRIIRKYQRQLPTELYASVFKE